MSPRFAVLIFSTLAPMGARDHPAMVAEEFIHEPGAYAACHAPTIVETTEGRLVAAWFGGTAEGNPDVGIWLARREEGRWTQGVKVVDGAQPDGSRFPAWNPVLFQPRGGPLMLFCKVGPSPREWWGLLTTSSDGGHTWSPPRRLPPGVIGPDKNKPLQLADGTLLCGSSTEDPARGWQVHLEMTPDLGRSWAEVGPINRREEFNAIQPGFLIHPDGRLQMLCRTREMAVVTSWSRDQGLTWSPLAPTGLRSPNSGLDALTLADGRHVLVYNWRDPQAPPPGPDDWGVRWPLNLALSSDGLNWTMALTLEGQPHKIGYAYPAVIQTRDGLIHVVYSWNREKIKHVVIDPRRLTPAPVATGSSP
jgi:predicted neuraminidase